jgi:hypothetical protein
MLQLKNGTPFKAAIAKFPNVLGVDTLYVVISASFELWPCLALCEEQSEPVRSDDYYGEPGSSSLRYAGELHLGKPSTDVILVGQAHAPGGKPVTELSVGLRVADREHMVHVFGDRQWQGLGPSTPAPFVSIPLVYERAFGGCLRSEGAPTVTEERNPVGVGLALAHGCPTRSDPLPNIENPKRLLDAGVLPTPAGFGCIAPSWLPRRSLAGTYDDEWQHSRAPYLPEDFDSRYFNCASQGLTFERYLQGGEPLWLLGVSKRGPLTTKLPICKLGTVFVLRGQRYPRPNHLQTVLIEPDENRLRLTFHTEFACDKLALEVERVEIAIETLDFGVQE